MPNHIDLRHLTFVNVLKHFPVENSVYCNKNGDVTNELDQELGARVWRLYGLVASNNFLSFPGLKGSPKTLGIMADYLYIQFKPVCSRFFVMHFDLIARQKQRLRITLTNFIKEPKVWSRVIQYPCLPPSRWVQVVLHIPSLLAQYTKLNPHGFTISAVTICANCYLRGIYASNTFFTTYSTHNSLQDAPRDVLMISPKNKHMLESIPWIYIPLGTRPLSCKPISPELAVNCDDTDIRSKSAQNLSNKLGSSNEEMSNYAESPSINKNLATGSSKDKEGSERNFATGAILRANRLLGLAQLSALHRHSSLWVGNEQILSVQSSALLFLDLHTGNSRCLFGHTGFIDFIESSLEFGLVGTVQNDEIPTIRIWKLPSPKDFSDDIRCTSIIQSPTLRSISILKLDGQEQSMVMVGTDNQQRQQIQVWDISGIRNNGRAILRARQVSDFQIEDLGISPTDPKKLVTCGKENIRFWNIKNGHLPGCSVVIGILARRNTFTSVCYYVDHVGEDFRSSTTSVVVASTSGNVMQVDCETRTVQRVHHLHDAPIWCISVANGLCATASADRTIKVWPISFSAPYFSTVFNGEVVSVAFSSAGDRLLCTTEDGSTSVLDFRRHRRLQVCRTISQPILDAAISVRNQQLYTACGDHTIRTWSLPCLNQIFEFHSNRETPLRLAVHPSEPVLAAGFDSGTLRVFNLNGPTVTLEAKHHQYPIIGIWIEKVQYNSAKNMLKRVRNEKDGLWTNVLVTADSTACVCMHAEELDYALIRRIDRIVSDVPPKNVVMLRFSPDSSTVASYYDSKTVMFYKFPSFVRFEEIHLGSELHHDESICDFGFCSANNEFYICSSDSKMRIYRLNLLSEIKDSTSINQINNYTSWVVYKNFPLLCGTPTASWVGGNYKISGYQVAVTAGSDRMIKVWKLFNKNKTTNDCMNSASSRCLKESMFSPNCLTTHSQEPPVFQSFSGHISAPFQLNLCGQWLISVSTSEVVVWDVASENIQNKNDEKRKIICAKPELHHNNEKNLVSCASLLKKFPVFGSKQISTTCDEVHINKKPNYFVSQNKRTFTEKNPHIENQSVNMQNNSKIIKKNNCVSDEQDGSEIREETTVIDEKNNDVVTKSLDHGIKFDINKHQELCRERADLILKRSRNKQFALKTILVRHLVGTTVAKCRSGCVWKATHGILAHAAGNSIMLERLAYPSVKSNCEDALGLLPFHFGRNKQFKTKLLAQIRKRISWQDAVSIKSTPLPFRINSADTNCSIAEASNSNTKLSNSDREKQNLIDLCFREIGNPRQALLSHPLIGRVIAMAFEAKGRLLASVNEIIIDGKESRNPEEERKHLVGDGSENTCRLCLCIWETWKSFELISAVHLPPQYSRIVRNSLNQGTTSKEQEGSCCYASQLGSTNLKHTYQEFPASHEVQFDSNPQQNEFDTGVLFCGNQYVATAGGRIVHRLDIWRLTDFLETPAAQVVFSSEYKDLLGNNLCLHNYNTGTFQNIPYKMDEHNSVDWILQAGLAGLNSIQPAVGVEVEEAAERLVTTAENNLYELAYIARQNVTLWRITNSGSGKTLKECKSGVLGLQFQYVPRPKNMQIDPKIVFTTGCLTRRSRSDPRILLLATNYGYIYGYNYESNTLDFELNAANEPISSISCESAKILTFAQESTARQATIDMQRLLGRNAADGILSVNILPDSKSQPLLLGSRIKSIQLESGADEGIVSTASNSIWYIQWSRRARIRIVSGVVAPIVALSSNFDVCQGNENTQRLTGSQEKPMWLNNPILVTASLDKRISLWRCRPRPHQLASFSVPYICTSLEFLRQNLLLSAHKDGCIRFLNLKSFTFAGRLQVASGEDPPLVIKCLNDRHALVGTYSGEVYFLTIDTYDIRVSEKPRTMESRVKHASISKITEILHKALLQKYPSQSLNNNEGDISVAQISRSLLCLATHRSRSTTEIESEEDPTHSINPPGQNAATFAVLFNGGLLVAGVYNTYRLNDAKGNALCLDNCFEITLPQRGWASNRIQFIHAVFASKYNLICTIGSFIFQVDLRTQMPVKEFNMTEFMQMNHNLNNLCNEISSVTCPDEEIVVIVLKNGSIFSLNIDAWACCGCTNGSLHPCLSKSKQLSETTKISSSTVSSAQIAISADTCISIIEII